jgi:nitrogen fixation NifU-like protein
VEPHSHEANGYNPLCGDRVTIQLSIEDGVIANIGFQGDGCAISTASASIMTEALEGKTVEEAQVLFDRFHDLVTRDDADHEPTLGKIAVLAGVRDYTMRVKCATLAWHTLHAALEEKDEVSTE